MFEKVGIGDFGEGSVSGREDELGCWLVSGRHNPNFWTTGQYSMVCPGMLGGSQQTGQLLFGSIDLFEVEFVDCLICNVTPLSGIIECGRL